MTTPDTAKTEDKMGWKEGDVVWTKSPPTAHRLADKTKTPPAPPGK